jgi:uncharacterized protein DUF6152
MRSVRALVTVSAFTAFVLPVLAHHSLEDAFDVKRTVTLTGHVSRVEWANPHARLFVDVKSAAGELTAWVVEIKPPRAMERIGLDAAMLSQADIDVDVWLAKDGSLSASGRTLRMPDGTVLDVASGMNWRATR